MIMMRFFFEKYWKSNKNSVGSNKGKKLWFENGIYSYYVNHNYITRKYKRIYIVFVSSLYWINISFEWSNIFFFFFWCRCHNSHKCCSQILFEDLTVIIKNNWYMNWIVSQKHFYLPYKCNCGWKKRIILIKLLAAFG